jgi:hypothetical protein
VEKKPRDASSLADFLPSSSEIAHGLTVRPGEHEIIWIFPLCTARKQDPNRLVRLWVTTAAR